MLSHGSAIWRKGGPVTDSFRFRYTLSKGDLVGALRTQALRSRYLWVTVALFALVAGYAFYRDMAGVLAGYKPLVSLLRTVLTFGGLGVAWWASHWLLPYWTAQRYPDIGVEKELTVSDKGLTWRSALESSDLTWAKYTGAVETEEFFLLYQGRANFTPIPKRGLADSSAQSRFRELVRANVADASGLQLG